MLMSDSGSTKSQLLSSKLVFLQSHLRFSDRLVYINRGLDLNESNGLLDVRVNPPTNVHPLFVATNGARDRDKKLAGTYISDSISKCLSCFIL